MNNTASVMTHADLAQSLNIHSAATFRMLDTKASPRSCTGWFVLELMLSGTLEIDAASSGWRRLQYGGGVIYGPNTTYRERVVPDGTNRNCHSFAVLFECATVVPGVLPSTDGDFRLVDDPSHQLLHTIERIVQSWHSGPAGQLLAHSCLMQAIAMLMLAEQRGQQLVISTGQMGLPLLVQKAHRVMTEKMNYPLRVSDLAKAVDLSPSGFAHAYRRITGRSPMTTLREMRINAVKRHLQSTDMTLEQIAEQTGFADAFHLSRTFKQVVGNSPRAYVKQLRRVEPI